jgi:alkaline phosphatase
MTRYALIAVVACSGGAPGSGQDDAAPAGDGGCDAAGTSVDAPVADRPQVILFIGDGMGPVHVDLTSRYVTGEPGQLAMHDLEHRAEIMTASASGITDSAAAATAMATGALTFNDRVAIDRDGVVSESILEAARARGLATGVVTTAALPHATPAAFTAHHLDRDALFAIAAQQIDAGVDVLLGGGAAYFDAAEVAARGYARVSDAAGLEAIDPATTDRLFGAFAADHLPYVAARGAATPGLEAMTAAALEILERDADGFVLIVEAARIDHASHVNLIGPALGETAELDRAVAAAIDWAAGRDAVTIAVVADHETGGLDPIANAGAGALPRVSWRWGEHTNRRVELRATGPGAAAIDGGLFDQRITCELLRAAIDGAAIAPPAPEILATGHTSDLDVDLAAQTGATGAALRLDRLRAGSDDSGLTIGVEGLFSLTEGALVVLIDADHGASTGPASLAAVPETSFDPLSRFVERLEVDGSAIAGFGIDAVAVSIRGVESNLTGGIEPTAGIRAIDPGGAPDASIGGVAIVYDDGVRQGFAAPGSGAELHIPWDRLYPGGAPPAGPIAVVALLVDASGSPASDQMLPPSATAGVIESVAVIAP